MMRSRSIPRLRAAAAIALAIAAGGCDLLRPARALATIRYAGSSTVANFLRDAEPIYGAARFEIDDSVESDGGERAILEGRTQLAGIARTPRPEVLRAGIAATFIGRDAIAVIVNAGISDDPRHPVANLTRAQLRDIFTGVVTSWKQAGGPEVPVRPFIVGPQSATRKVFRDVVLQGARYAGCTEVSPDRDVIEAVASTPGGIGHISFSFLRGATGVRAIAVDGIEPRVTNFDYPIARPLYLLWREGDPDVERFVEWTQTEAGQRVVTRRFVGIRVVADVRPAAGKAARTGTLVVYTVTYPVYDGGIYYYPHRGYDILRPDGTFVRRVVNHRGENDEKPMRVRLPPGRYIVRPHGPAAAQPEFLVTIEAGRTTVVDVEELTR